ncbi:tetratricopeptide repeat-containing sensor histidine kinase [Cellulophaga sp. HaHa_2_95]|uniref:tetratricopeptide repeat-containing sensor histidine kinase n=1 Tax=Cellulophaga sp. HaHa_2_95 TaxID=2745558 RepID=UPI001C4FCDAE|nr:ATP-binding protein [Cellulophaga sp. HaHa_2_95]QXP57968.1 tetratricopeptide repeat-containing sensor histidine kinase [Cellulophaga sp. HaHa_2_95]
MKCNYSTLIAVLIFCTFLNIPKLTAQGKKQEIISKIKAHRLQGKEKDSSYINLINALSRELRYSNYDSVKILSTEALDLSRKINYKQGQAKALLTSSFSEIIACKDSEKTLDNIDQAIVLSTKIKADSTLISAYNIKAIYKTYVNDYEGAYEQYQNALLLCENNRHPLEETKLYSNLATLFSVLGDNDESIKIYIKALAITDRLEDKFWVGVVKSNLGFLYNKTHQFDKAIIFLDESIQIFIEVDRKEWLAYAYLTKANILLNKNETKEALRYLDLSKGLQKNLIDEKLKQDLLLGYTKYHQQINELEKSEELAKKGYLSSIDNQNQILIANFSEILYQLNKEKENQKEALFYLEKFKNITDSTALQSKQNALALLNAKTNFQKQQNDLKLENQRTIKQQKTYIIFSLFIVFLVILIAYYGYRNNKTITNLNYQLEEKTITLEKSEKTLKYANETQEKLFSIISHDLKSPINALKNLLLLIKNGDIEPKDFLNFVPKLYSDVDAMSFTLNNLLTWSKSQMNGFVNKPISFQIHEKVNSSIQLLQENANQKKIAIVNNVPTSAEIYCDVNQFNLIVRNLVTNGIKFTPSGGEIRIHADEKNQFWEISIKDNGVGISPEVLKKLFKSDSALHSTYGTNKEKGTGLGLLLCKEMVEKNGGKISVESIPNEGTTFYFTMPTNPDSIN